MTMIEFERTSPIDVVVPQRSADSTARSSVDDAQRARLEQLRSRRAGRTAPPLPD
ncbi:MAG: hypothetical protein IT196_16770, partial [Acidimicrobiales bacterium]|nr:hypothetical protein [Acidimicrobiales bacterium]